MYTIICDSIQTLGKSSDRDANEKTGGPQGKIQCLVGTVEGSQGRYLGGVSISTSCTLGIMTKRV